MCQLKPRHNLRDPMRPAIASAFYSSCLNSFSLPLSFFLIRWDFIRPPLLVTATGCEISEGKACGNPSISGAHLTQHLYRRAGGFWKGAKCFTKSISKAGLTQTDSGNTFIPRSTSPLCFRLCSLLVFFVQHLRRAILAHGESDLQHCEITFEARLPFAWICWADMEKRCETR